MLICLFFFDFQIFSGSPLVEEGSRFSRAYCSSGLKTPTMIQAVTSLAPSWRSPTAPEKGHLKPPKRSLGRTWYSSNLSHKKSFSQVLRRWPLENPERCDQPMDGISVGIEQPGATWLFGFICRGFHYSVWFYDASVFSKWWNFKEFW